MYVLINSILVYYNNFSHNSILSSVNTNIFFLRCVIFKKNVQGRQIKMKGKESDAELLYS